MISWWHPGTLPKGIPAERTTLQEPPIWHWIFLTVQGKILPCEKVGQQYPLGYVRDGKINLDSKEVKQLYLKLYTPIVDKCKKCLLWKNCEICVFYLPKDEEGQTVCPYYLGNEDVNRYFSTYIYALEKHPDLLDRIENEILID